MKKGFALNDERLRNPREFGADYFDELLERIRDIRASEKRVYQKVKEIFALSVDYDSKSQVAQNFFKSVQNKLEYAATGHTAQSSLPIGPMLSRITWDSLLLRESKCAGAM